MTTVRPESASQRDSITHTTTPAKDATCTEN